MGLRETFAFRTEDCQAAIDTAGEPVYARRRGSDLSMRTFHNDLDFDEAYKTSWFSVDRCWISCGSHCCTFRSIVKHFRLFRDPGAVLPLFPGEFEFLEAKGVLQQGFKETRREVNVPIPGSSGDQAGFSFDFVTCRLEGACSFPQWRPLVCRLYPLLPRIDDAGHVLNFLPIAYQDLFWKDLGVEDPCLVRLNAKFQEETLRSLECLLSKRMGRFCLGAASIVMEAIYRRVSESAREEIASGPDAFFRRLEAMSLRGQLFDKKRVLQKVADWRRKVFEDISASGSGT